MEQRYFNNMDEEVQQQGRGASDNNSFWETLDKQFANPWIRTQASRPFSDLQSSTIHVPQWKLKDTKTDDFAFFPSIQISWQFQCW